MFHVLDNSGVVYTGNLSESTQYVIDHYGQRLDEAVRSGIKILYTDMLHSLTHAKEIVCGHPSHELWHPIDDWRVD